jgi:hypothetical protein
LRPFFVEEEAMTTQKQTLPKPKVAYVQDTTILDIDPDTILPFENWDQAEQFAMGIQQSDSINRWLIGLQAGKLPLEDKHNNFNRWCDQVGFSPGRVNVWRNMTQVFDFKQEVQKFPRLSHTHFEKMMGRMSKAKEKGDGQLYEHVMATLEEAENQHYSCSKMIAEMLTKEGKSKARSELPLKIQGQLDIKRVSIAPPGKPFNHRTCIVIIPNSEEEGLRWKQSANDHDLLYEMVKASMERAGTE